MTRPSGPNGGHRAAGHACKERTEAGAACPVAAMKRPDVDGGWRCHHHALSPAVREAMRVARQRGGFEATGQSPAEITYERFTTAESVDALLDEALSVLRAELRLRKADKVRVSGGIAQMVDTKLKLKSLEYTARALHRLKPGALAEMAS